MRSQVVDDLSDLFGRFVSKMDSKREIDYKKIEKIYQEMTIDQRKQIFSFQREKTVQQSEIQELKKIIHTLKCKLASDFSLIINLRREIEFVREHSRIIEEENIKITSAMKTLLQDLKVLDTTSDGLRPHVQEFEKCLEVGRTSSEYLTQNYKSQVEAGLNPKQRNELNRMMTQDDLPYDGFMTCDKSCSTANLVSTNTVTVNFKKLSDKKEVADVSTQKIDLKPRTKDASIQVYIPNWENQTSHRPGSSQDDDSAASNSVYKRKMMDRYKIEHMHVNSGERKSILVKQTSIIPDTITELMELSHCNDDERNNVFKSSALPSETDVLLTLPKGKGKNHSRSGRVSFSLKPPQRSQNRKFTSAEKSEDREPKSRDSQNFTAAVNEIHSKTKNADKLAAHKLKAAGRRIMASQRTINSFKPEIGSPNDSINGSTLLEKSPRTLVEMDHLENYKETKLRNELIRQKQQYKTLCNRLANCEEDPEKATQIQTLLDSSAAIIEKLEKQLKTFKKTSDFAERMSQFKPANPPTLTLISNFESSRKKYWRTEYHQGSPKTK